MLLTPAAGPAARFSVSAGKSGATEASRADGDASRQPSGSGWAGAASVEIVLAPLSLPSRATMAPEARFAGTAWGTGMR